MSISNRYRQILLEIEQQAVTLRMREAAENNKVLGAIDAALTELRPVAETVGEVPQYQLERTLSPVLLKAHGKLDRARVLLEDAGRERDGERIWELEQFIYRLLNDL